MKTEFYIQNVSRCVQAARADTALGLVQVQHLRQLQELQERVGDGRREQAELLQARLVEEQRRSQQLEEALRLQAQQSSSQISMKQVNTQRSKVTGFNRRDCISRGLTSELNNVT